MKIKWKFWTKTGKTFFRVRQECSIDADAMEHVVAYYTWVEEWNAKVLVEYVKSHISTHGTPSSWETESISCELDEAERLLAEARETVKRIFPKAYEIYGQ